ncbi:hypothetical protein JW998_03345 [candidate division KSB1 bacterium]|nr:hypothetical protein [candidate division KSB1 bacterium]
MNKFVIYIILLALPCALFAGMPSIGAQIWIEPGQTEAEIDGWFMTLANLQMPITRLFILWNVIEPEKDVWDFDLYDLAFAAALIMSFSGCSTGGCAAMKRANGPCSISMANRPNASSKRCRWLRS